MIPIRHHLMNTHLMHHQKFDPPIKNPIFDVRKNRPNPQLINDALEKVSRNSIKFYSLSGF